MSKASGSIILQNDFIRLVIDKKARLTGIIDKATGKNYCASPCHFWEIVINKQKYLPSEVSMKGQEISVRFGSVAQARFLIKNKKHYFSMELISVSSEFVSEITLANLSVKKLKNTAQPLNACYDDNFAFCVMALTLPVHCVPTGSTLTARCYSKYGTKGSRIAIIGCPFPRFKNVIEEVETGEGLPCIKLSGAWAKNSPDIKRSYLFIHDLGEENCDKVIECAKKMNAGMIMILESWCDYISGHHPISKKLFPHGINGLKKVVDKIHKAGLKTGLHSLVTGISANDKYITPVPDKRFFKDGLVTLSADIGKEAADIPFNEYPLGFPAALNPQGLYFGNAMDIQIDDEIITYSARSEKEPYEFSKCTRGAYGTKPAFHKKGTEVYHMMRSFGLFVKDVDTDIIDEVAQRVADIVNYCGFDMMYFDGSEWLQGDHWYYNARIHSVFYSKIDPARRSKMFYQASSQSHFSWHMLSRHACADGYKKVKENINNAMNGWPGLLANFMALDIGWYGIGGDISHSDIEYILCRSIGWNSSCGFSTPLSNLESNPETLEMIGNYEKLRLQNYFPEKIKAKLRNPGEYHLVKAKDGKWVFEQKQPASA